MSETAAAQAMGYRDAYDGVCGDLAHKTAEYEELKAAIMRFLVEGVVARHVGQIKGLSGGDHILFVTPHFEAALVAEMVGLDRDSICKGLPHLRREGSGYRELPPREREEWCPCCGKKNDCYCRDYPHPSNPECPGRPAVSR